MNVLKFLIFKTHTLCPPTLGRGAEVCFPGQRGIRRSEPSSGLLRCVQTEPLGLSSSETGNHLMCAPHEFSKLQLEHGIQVLIIPAGKVLSPFFFLKNVIGLNRFVAPTPTSRRCGWISPGHPVGLWHCCSVEVGQVERREAESCAASAWGWAPLRPHCLCWMKMVVEVGVAWAVGLRMAVFSLWLILYCWLVSGSGSSDTPGRSSRGRSRGWATSQGSELVEEGWCWPPGDHLGSAVAQGPDPKPLFLQLRTSEGQIRCRAFRC